MGIISPGGNVRQDGAFTLDVSQRGKSLGDGRAADGLGETSEGWEGGLHRSDGDLRVDRSLLAERSD